MIDSNTIRTSSGINQDTVIQQISISEPGTLLLFGSGLPGITVWRRRRKGMQS